MDKYGRIALITKQPNPEQLLFGDLSQQEQEHASEMLSEILSCIHQWSTRSIYFEQIYKNLIKSKVIFKSTDKSPKSLSSKEISSSISSSLLPKVPLNDRVRMKVALLKETLYFLYSCFVLKALSDETSQILLMCNDLMVSLELEKECLVASSEDECETLMRITKLKQLLTHMNQDYTRGESLANYIITYKKVLAGVLNVDEKSEDEKIKQEFEEELSSQKSKNREQLIGSLGLINSPIKANSPDRMNNLDRCSLKLIQSSGNITPAASTNYSIDSQPLRFGESSSSSRQGPLIYRMLKSLRSDNHLPSSSSSSSPSTHAMFSMTTPRIKQKISSSIERIESPGADKNLLQTQDTSPASPESCFLSNSSGSREQESYSYQIPSPSVENSPQMFSTSQPLFFQQIVRDLSDEVMESESSKKSSKSTSSSPQNNQVNKHQPAEDRSNTTTTTFNNKPLTSTSKLPINNNTGTTQGEETLDILVREGLPIQSKNHASALGSLSNYINRLKPHQQQADTLQNNQRSSSNYTINTSFNNHQRSSIERKIQQKEQGISTQSIFKSSSTIALSHSAFKPRQTTSSSLIQTNKKQDSSFSPSTITSQRSSIPSSQQNGHTSSNSPYKQTNSQNIFTTSKSQYSNNSQSILIQAGKANLSSHGITAATAAASHFSKSTLTTLTSHTRHHNNGNQININY